MLNKFVHKITVFFGGEEIALESGVCNSLPVAICAPINRDRVRTLFRRIETHYFHLLCCKIAIKEGISAYVFKPSEVFSQEEVIRYGYSTVLIEDKEKGEHPQDGSLALMLAERRSHCKDDLPSWTGEILTEYQFIERYECKIAVHCVLAVISLVEHS